MLMSWFIFKIDKFFKYKSKYCRGNCFLYYVVLIIKYLENITDERSKNLLIVLLPRDYYPSLTFDVWFVCVYLCVCVGHIFISKCQKCSY